MSGASKRVNKADLDHMRIHKHIRFNRLDVFLGRLFGLGYWEKHWYWKLRAASSQHILKGLTSWRVKFNRSKFTVSLPIVLIFIKRSGFHPDITSDVFSWKLVNVCINLGNFIGALVLNSKPFALNWNRETWTTFCLSIKDTWIY